jgi:hypothetical protein
MERKTIKVASVGQWRDVGKAKVLTFGGEDRVNYETWSETLAEHIKVGVTIEADVDFTQKTDAQGNTYLHNKVVQIYVDGQPVKSKSRGFTPDSPEKIASIESQKRADLICQLWMAGKIPDNHPLVKEALEWLGKLKIPKFPEPGSTVKVIDKKSGIETSGIMEFANAGEFLTACQKNLGLNKTQVLAGLGAKSLDSVNFADAYVFLKEGRAGTLPPEANNETR